MDHKEIVVIPTSKPYNTAQRILLACGVDPYLLEAHRKEHARKGRLPQHCKKGPGRYHQQGPLKEKADA